MEGMPRRVADYAAQFGDWNLLISLFAFMLGAAQLVFLYNMIVSWRFGPKAGPTRGGRRRSSGRSPRRRRSSTSTRSRASSAAPTSSACPAPGTRSCGSGEEAGRRLGRATEPDGGRSDLRRTRQDRHRSARAASRRPDRAVREGGTVLVFLNEVAGGRKLLKAVPRARRRRRRRTSPWSPRRTSPSSGSSSIVDELRDAAQSRVEVTQAVLAEFGIEADGAVMDPDPSLALDDAVRASKPDEVLLSCALRDPLRLHAQGPGRVGQGRRFEARSSTSRCASTTTRCAGTSPTRWWSATQTVNSPDLVERLKERAAEQPAPLHVHLPALRAMSAARRSARDLAATLAELYRDEIDATGQPMSPEPFPAIQNAIEHYRIDEILISTLAGRAVEVARGGPDRPRRGDHRQAGRARRGRAAARRASARAAPAPSGGGGA